jgi:hypothetical protein
LARLPRRDPTRRAGLVVKGLVELGLVVLSVAVLRELVRVRPRVLSGFPLLAAAVLGAAGTVAGGGEQTRLWAAGGVAFCLAAIIASAHDSRVLAIVTPAARRAAGVRIGLLASVYAWLVVVDFAVGRNPFTHLTSYLLVGCALGASMLLSSRGGLAGDVPAFVGLSVVALSDLGGVLNSERWRPCDQFKCSVLHGLFRGPYPSENTLALLATITFAWVLTGVSGRFRILGCLLCAATVFATGSRTGLLVCGVVAATALAAAHWQTYRARRLPRVIAHAVVGATAATGLYLLYHASASQFSDRGEVWQQALAMVHGHDLNGVGLSTYRVLQGEGLVSPHFTHSEYLLLLFAGGFVGVSIFVLWASFTMRALVEAAGSLVAVTPVLAFVLYSLTEAVWNPLAFDATAWMPLAFCLVTHKPRAGGAADQMSDSDAVSYGRLHPGAKPRPIGVHSH